MILIINVLNVFFLAPGFEPKTLYMFKVKASLIDGPIAQ